MKQRLFRLFQPGKARLQLCIDELSLRLQEEMQKTRYIRQVVESADRVREAEIFFLKDRFSYLVLTLNELDSSPHSENATFLLAIYNNEDFKAKWPKAIASLMFVRIGDVYKILEVQVDPEYADCDLEERLKRRICKEAILSNKITHIIAYPKLGIEDAYYAHVFKNYVLVKSPENGEIPHYRLSLDFIDRIKCAV